MRRRKVIAGSLESKLTEEQRDHLLFSLIVKGMSYEDAVGLCGDWQVSTSESSLVRFLDSAGAEWTLRRADAQAETLLRSKPKDMEEKRRVGLKKKFFEAAYSNLTVKELAALLRIQVQQERNALDSRRVEVLEKRLAAVTKVVEEADAAGGFTKEKLKEAQVALGIF